MRDKLPLDGRRALITGGASGIGRAIAQRLAADGASVLVMDRDKSGAREIAKEVGGDYRVIDLADIAAVLDLSEDADILINNAGVQHVAPIEEFDIVQFSLMQRLMIEAPFHLTRMVLPSMYAKGWGRFIHISSVHGHRASPYKSAYVMAKHAIEGLSKTIAVEGAGKGVTSNTVAPGYVRTALVKNQIASQARSHDLDERGVIDQILLARTPIQRLVDPSEVAAGVAYLCGPGSRSITGSSLHIDGGWTAT
jgi:3-hydroxybutyrate dehydrogenase